MDDTAKPAYPFPGIVWESPERDSIPFPIVEFRLGPGGIVAGMESIKPGKLDLSIFLCPDGQFHEFHEEKNATEQHHPDMASFAHGLTQSLDF